MLKAYARGIHYYNSDVTFKPYNESNDYDNIN